MATEQQIKELAYAIWEKEGRPEGKEVEHYFRSKQILEERQASSLSKSTPPPISKWPQRAPIPQLALPVDADVPLGQHNTEGMLTVRKRNKGVWRSSRKH